MVRPGQVTRPDGSRGDLLDYAAAHQQDLALKPAVGHGGIGVILGWGNLSPARWRGQLASGSGAPFIVQRRIRPTPEPFPTEEGGPTPWIPVWGVFTTAPGYGGVSSRVAPAIEGLGVVNAAMGAESGPCLSQDRPAATQGVQRPLVG
jgi:hypothetical protein